MQGAKTVSSRISPQPTGLSKYSPPSKVKMCCGLSLSHLLLMTSESCCEPKGQGAPCGLVFPSQALQSDSKIPGAVARPSASSLPGTSLWPTSTVPTRHRPLSHRPHLLSPHLLSLTHTTSNVALHSTSELALHRAPHFCSLNDHGAGESPLVTVWHRRENRSCF